MKDRFPTNILRFLVRWFLHRALRFFMHLKHMAESNEEQWSLALQLS